MDQFEANRKLFSEDQVNAIQNTNILLVGAGGLGGYIANALVRMGVKKLTIIDYDRYDYSNLNRQLFSSHDSIDCFKVDIVKEACLKIYPQCQINTFKEPIETLEKEMSKSPPDFIFDAVDSILTRRYLETQATVLNVPLIHGAIGGWYGQFGIIMPKSNIIQKIYGDSEKGLEKTLGSPTFTPAVIANFMVTEFIKFVTKDENALINRIMFVDLQHYDFHVMYDLSKKNQK